MTRSAGLKEMLTFGSLFAGIGGFDLGFERTRVDEMVQYYHGVWQNSVDMQTIGEVTMGSHQDADHGLDERRREFMKELNLRAEIMSDLGKNDLQDGRVLLQWTHDNGVRCQLLPADRQGILRISVGGGDDLPVLGDYCNFRGDVGKCIGLLERVLEALKGCPENA